MKVTMPVNEEITDYFLFCPYCQYRHEDVADLDDSDDNYQCPTCGKTFSYIRQYIPEFTSRTLEFIEEDL